MQASPGTAPTALPRRLASAACVALTLSLIVTWSSSPASADIQNPAQQKCALKATSSGLKIAKTQGKEARGCIRDIARNGFSSLYQGLSCLTADQRGRIAAIRAKTASSLAVTCVAPPDFGFDSIAAVGDAAVEEDSGLVREVFGPGLSAAIIRRDASPAGSSCQSTAQGDYERVLAAKLKAYAKCEKNGYKSGAITAVANLEACVDTIKSSSQKKVVDALAKLRADVSDRCACVQIRDGFPGRCSTELSIAALNDCLAEAIDCRACTMLSSMHGLDVDCDVFDDGVTNASCLPGIDVPTTTLPPWAGACTNDEDQSVLASVNIQQKTRACTLECLFSATRPQCIAACIVDDTGLGAACAFCYADSSECGIHNCAGPCASNQSSPACVSCLENAGCIDAFDECAGTSPTSTTTNPPVSSTTTTTAPGGTTTTTLAIVGACSNPADEAVDASFDLQAEATTCTLSCLGSGAPNLPQCVAACVSSATGLSTDCAHCYGQSSQCGLDHCAAECAINQSSPACVSCLATNCVPAFEQCSAGSPTTTVDTPTTTAGATTTTVTNGTTTTLPPAPGACTNTADEAVLQSVDIQAETRTCTLGCLSAGNRPQCIADCIVAATGLSPECSLCYGDSSECGIQNCAAQCAVNQSSPACVSCVNAHCIPAFNQCAGTTSATTTTVGNNTTTTTVPVTTTTLPGGAGACINGPDQTVSNSFNLQAETTTCTIGCLSAGNRPACVSTCLQNGTGLSSGCAGCYAQSSECGLQHCAAQCAVNQSSAPCLACLEVNCVSAFNACSGEGEPPPPATCTNGMRDGTETDVDCGGACDPCAIGDTCGVAADCRSGNCSAGVCAAPSTALALGSCAQGYIDPFTDPDAVNLGGLPATGSDDGYRVTLSSPSDVFIELTNQLNGTATLNAALVTVSDNGASAVAGLTTGAVVSGQNGTGGPATVNAGTYYLYVDSQVAGTYGPYQVCLVPPPTIAINTCVTGTVGNGDGDNVQIAGANGAGGDKGLRFTAPVGTGNVIMTLRNVSGASKMAAAIYNGATQLPGSETPDAALFTERTVGPFPVSANIAYTVQVDTADADTFGTFEVCVYKAGCGDGLVTGGEQCDDTNTTSGDGCSSTCTLESGKIVVNSCRTDNIPLFGSDCDDWTLPIAQNDSVYVELTNPFGGTLLGIGSLRLGGSQLASTGNVPVGQTGSTGVTNVTAPNNYTVRVCDVTGAGTGNYTVCVRRARRIELGTCFSSNVTDGDGNVIDLAGPISGGDEDVLFQPPATIDVKLTLSNDSVGGLLASGIYDGQPGSLLPGSAVGASPNPIPVGMSGTSGIVAVNGGQIYRVYTDIASLGTAGTNYTICLAEVAGDSCLNPDDEAVRAAYNLSAEAEDAGLSCTGNSSCISQTLQNDTGLSAGCADCYGGVGGCAASNCAFQCLGDSGSSGCRNCVASNCAQEFEVCSGWTYGQ